MGVENGEIVNIEGDPDCPLNEGSLCPKGMSLRQLDDNEERLTKVKHRAAGASGWEEISWDEAITRIAAKIKETRDTGWMEKDGDGNTVNRTEVIASVGSVLPNSEEAYLYSKMLRALGLVYIENEARICVSAAVSADIETVGRGPMSNHWIDLVNSDCIMAIGGNIAESFPIAFKHVTRAVEKGAKLIHVDPRFTRTSAKADLYARVRSGTDIAFVGGILRYVLDDMEANPDNYNMEYLWNYTDAAYLVDSGFEGPADTLTGLFSGWDSATGSYDSTAGGWAYTGTTDSGSQTAPPQDANSVFQLLKRHFARYTDDKVVEITGTDKLTFQEICRTYAATGQNGKSGAIVFSSSACQRSTGTQTVRTYGILQLLLGNMGVSGGGLDGITGAVNGLGCTLQGLVNHWGPGGGSVRMPLPSEQNLSGYGKDKARFASILKAWYCDTDVETSFNYLPKSTGTYHWQSLFKAIDDGDIKGLLCWGMNPAVSGPNSAAARDALRKLEWMVVIDLWETETAAVWQEGSCNTEVFLLPSATPLEKEGSVCNGGRWNQWRNKAIDPPGDAQSDLWIIDRLVRKLNDLYRADAAAPNREAIIGLFPGWDYGDPPDVHAVAKEMNGYDLAANQLLSSPGSLKDDGTTSCGNWLWCGSYTGDGNMMARRGTNDSSGIGLFSNWGWAWPLNRRIMYNRASVDLDGHPWDGADPVISWDSTYAEWVGDVADGGTAPISDGGGYPFIMKTDTPVGRGRLFGKGKKDGPFPEHYEPWESPVSNAMSSQQSNPALKSWETEATQGSSADYPIVATTYRTVDHFHTGAITRRIPWLKELNPEIVVEISEELAEERTIADGGAILVESARGSVQARALVTKRLRPFHINGTTVHQISVPWNWGSKGLCTGDSANLLTPRIGDPNTCIPEFRAFLCRVQKV